MRINIYVETTCKGPRELRSVGMYVMEALNDDGSQFIVMGEPWVVTKKKEFENINHSRQILELLTEAFGRIQKPADVWIYTTCEGVYFTLLNRWNLQWQQNGWKTSKGSPPKHIDLWKPLTESMAPHTWEVSNETHSFLMWMREQIKKAC